MPRCTLGHVVVNGLLHAVWCWESYRSSPLTTTWPRVHRGTRWSSARLLSFHWHFHRRFQSRRARPAVPLCCTMVDGLKSSTLIKCSPHFGKMSHVTSCVNSSVIWNPNDRFISPNRVLTCRSCSLTTRAITSRRRAYSEARNCCGWGWQCWIMYIAFKTTIVCVRDTAKAVITRTFVLIAKQNYQKMLVHFSFFCSKSLQWNFPFERSRSHW